ncbi:hypothetical protein [Haloferula sp.]|uniref:hypothetical protein n=1 Tax=Haloferula sp. TaxID=2497595 RepID=UPI003C7756A2
MARSNARLALLLAIGELQKAAGADTRITASAEAVAGVNGPSQLTGAWRSWEGQDHDPESGLPTSPDYASKLTRSQPADSGSNGHFITWLVSGPERGNDAASPPELKAGAGTTPLLSTGSLKPGSEKEVHLRATAVEDGGRIAWWIQGQNSKALVTPPEAEPLDSRSWSRRLASHGRAEASDFGFGEPEELALAASYKSLDLMSNSLAHGSGRTVTTEYFHDMTNCSRGLLTNSANGGWRRDLSLFSELAHPSSDKLPRSGLAVFSRKPGEEHEASLRIRDGGGKNGAIYPWATGTEDSMSWNALVDFMTLYKKVRRTPNGEPYLEAFDPTTPDNSDDLADEIMISPVLARKHWIFSYWSVPQGNFFNPRLINKNVMTFWNPYNVAIQSRGTGPYYQGRREESYPRFHFDISVGGETRSISLQKMFNGDQPNTRVIVEFDESSDTLWKPGESRIYSNSGSYSRITATQQVIRVRPGYQPDGGSYRAWDGYPARKGQDEVMSASIRNSAPGDRFEFHIDTTFTEGSSNLKRQEFSMPSATFSEKIPIPTLNNRKALKQVAGEGNEFPFATIVFGLRDLLAANIRTKGYINTKPILSYGRANGDDSLEDSSYDLRVYGTTSFNAPEIPSSDDDLSFGNDHSGYVGTSHTAQFGIPRWAITELPTQPLLSLCELQHFDIGFNNPLPPRVAHPLGNSNATPKMRPEVMKRPGLTAYDHSYASNHLFFDDWFISSITPDGNGADLREVLAGHLTGESPLRNSNYRPAIILNDSAAEDTADEMLDDEDAWRKVAAGLEVEGMFNINSTSKNAWSALLKNQKNSRVPTIKINPSQAGSWEAELDSTNNNPFSRTSVVSSGDATPPDNSLLVEPFDMTDTQIDALAEEIVEQIKKRGPFLSLSEFINRQLGTDDDLALAGAVESALVELSKSASTERNPYSAIQKSFPQQASQFSDRNEIHAYPEAAEGSAVYGTPGWGRQADILRPIAPILSARDDTFIIRAYGSSVEPGTGDIKAQTWCEAIVQRKSAYVDSTDPATGSVDLCPANKTFGRKLDVIFFRWLSAEEV